MLKFDDKSFLKTSLSFVLFLDYKHTNASLVDSPGVKNSEKIITLRTLWKIHLKCDCVDGSVVKGLSQPLLFSSFLNKLPGYKFFLSLEQFCIKKLIPVWIL